MSRKSSRIIGLVCRSADDGSGQWLGGTSALDRTLGQLAKVRSISAVCVVEVDSKAVQRARVARAWSPTGWRGGIGGASIYDEIIDARACALAVEGAGAEGAYIVGADWPLVDVGLSERVIERFIEREDHQMVFTQSPPGLCGIVLGGEVLSEMARHGAGVNHLLDYQPATPRPDPTGRDGCVQVDSAIRSAPVRATMQSRRWAELLEEYFSEESSGDTVSALAQLTARLIERGQSTPQQVSLDLTPRRKVSGPLVPVSQIQIDRSDMTMATLESMLPYLAQIDDLALTLGGLGDPLLHAEFDAMLNLLDRSLPRAVIAVVTDLLVERGRIDSLLDGRIDVLQVRLNADTPERYRELMGVDAFGEVTDQLKVIWHELRARGGSGGAGPLIVPSMVKCQQNVEEMESFYDRWLRAFGGALIEGPSTGAGLIEDQGVVDMAPPRRVACRQLRLRLSVLSDGSVPRCDQDWLGREAVGNVNDESLQTMWKRLQAVRTEHERGIYGGICGSCRAWHRP